MTDFNWKSNGDPPLYVYPNDIWYNQKNHVRYKADVDKRIWISLVDAEIIEFPKKTRVMNPIPTPRKPPPKDHKWNYKADPKPRKYD